jgi:general secretion pathway protein G
MTRRGRPGERGLSYIEVMATTAILAILAMVILPTAQAAHKRRKELELRASLRELRVAIDKFRMYCDPQSPVPRKIAPKEPPYPENLEDLTEGHQLLNQPPGNKKRFLRQIPVDPMTGDTEWGVRCYDDAPDSMSWCGKNVFDVYSKSPDKALDGTNYRDW